MYRILPNVYIFTTILHIRNDTPLPWVPWQRYHEERTVGLHLTPLRDRFEDTNRLKLVNERSGQLNLLVSHGGILDNPIGWFGQEICRTPISKIVPMFWGEFPPQQLKSVNGPVAFVIEMMDTQRFQPFRVQSLGIGPRAARRLPGVVIRPLEPGAKDLPHKGPEPSSPRSLQCHPWGESGRCPRLDLG
jgi:hypothetical protein